MQNNTLGRHGQAKNRGNADAVIFEKHSILFKVKEGENFNHSNTLSISRINI